MSGRVDGRKVVPLGSRCVRCGAETALGYDIGVKAENGAHERVPMCWEDYNRWLDSPEGKRAYALLSMPGSGNKLTAWKEPLRKVAAYKAAIMDWVNRTASELRSAGVGPAK